MAAIANIGALLPGTYCAYGTYILLRSDSTKSATSSLSEGHWLLVAIFLVCGCMLVAAVLSTVASFRRDRKLDQMYDLLSRLAQPTPNSTIPQTVVSADASRAIRLHLEEMTLGLRMLWLDKTFLFTACHIVSINKKTSVLQIKPTITVKDGSRLTCVLMEKLDEWYYEPPDSRLNLETLSLWKKLREQPLEEEVKLSGWLGIEVPLSAQKAGDFSSISAVELCIVDAAEREHFVSLRPPWPVNNEHLIVAKHVRQR